MRFVGVDLAWAERNGTGAVAVEWDGRAARVLEVETRLRGDDEVAGFVRGHLGGDCIVGVDAPLIVPNETGTRPCDRALQARFGRAHAGAYPANRRLLSAYGGGTPRGERLVAALGLSPDPRWTPGERGLRRIVEVFPHAAAVRLFGLDRIFGYKARPGRPRDFRLAELERYRAALRTLDVPLPQSLGVSLDELRGAGLKALEDGLDAFLCACVVLDAWRWGAEVVGDVEGGYVLLPARVVGLSRG